MISPPPRLLGDANVTGRVYDPAEVKWKAQKKAAATQAGPNQMSVIIPAVTGEMHEAEDTDALQKDPSGCSVGCGRAT